MSKRLSFRSPAPFSPPLPAGATLAEEARELEMKADRPRYRAWRNVMRTAEGRQVIVDRFLVRQINDSQTGTHLVFVALENIVMPHTDVEKIARRNARRVV